MVGEHLGTTGVGSEGGTPSEDADESSTDGEDLPRPSWPQSTRGQLPMRLRDYVLKLA